MKIALGQVNATIGGVERNLGKVRDMAREARARGASLLLLPEQVIPGYPAKELLRIPDLVEENLQAVDELARETSDGDLAIIVGCALPHEGGEKGLFGAAAFLANGRIGAMAKKRSLAQSLVSGEPKLFDPGAEATWVIHQGVRIGITLSGGLYGRTAARDREREVGELVAGGAEIVVDLSATPFVLHGCKERELLLGRLAKEQGVPIASCNLVGGNDSLVFPGRSLAFDAGGGLIGRGRCFEEDLLVVEVEPAKRATRAGKDAALPPAPAPSRIRSFAALDRIALEDIEAALCLGLRDYVHKSGFQKAVVGVSGGIDSAVVALLATLALGKENVTAVSMPSRYTSEMSNEDGEKLAMNLGIGFEVLPIEPALEGLLEVLAPSLGGSSVGTTEENLQARIRGVLLMALSNQRGAMVLGTGNKSEIAVGYCTLYGDMVGAIEVIGDVPKTWVYELARHLNLRYRAIPPRILSRPPSAELRPGQTDQDSLPSYDRLDRILHGFMVEGRSISELIQAGEEEATVRRVLSLLLGSEYKRRQGAPVIQLTSRAFGEDWNYPIAHALRF